MSPSTGRAAARIARFIVPDVVDSRAARHHRHDRAVQDVLTTMSSWNDRVQSWLFDPSRLAPTFTLAEVVDPPRYNAFYQIDEVKPVDVSTWTPIFTATGESALAPSQNPRVLTNSSAYFYDGRWTIRTSVVDRKTPC